MSVPRTRSRSGRVIAPAPQERAAAVAPIDEVDAEVVAAVSQDRPVDMERLFPEPPPPIAEMRAAGARPIDPEAEPVSLEQEQARRRHLLRRRRDISLPQSSGNPPPTPDPEASPATRLRAVAETSPAYFKEYRLKLIHRMLMRSLPVDMIAAKLEISIAEVSSLRRELQKRLAYEAQTINRYEIAGKTLSFYDEVQGMALRTADAHEAKPFVRLQALQTALSAQADRQRFLTASGFWGAAPFTPQDSTEDESSTKAGKLSSLIDAIVSPDGTFEMDEDATLDNESQSSDDVRLL